MSNFSSILSGRINVYRFAGATTSSLGQPVNVRSTVYTNLPARFFTRKGRVIVKPVGDKDASEHGVMIAGDRDIRQRDTVDFLYGATGVTNGMIDFVEVIHDFSGATHHLECRFV